MNHTPTSEQSRYSKTPTGGAKTPIVAIQQYSICLLTLECLKQSSVTYTVVTRSALQAPAAQSAVLSSKQLLTVKQAHTTDSS